MGTLIFPASFAQQRLWFLDRWQPGTALYNVARAVRLDGRLDVAALERSLDALCRRHESLRTTFAVCDASPVQVIAEEGALPLPVVDLAALGPALPEAEALRCAAAEVRRSFDLERGPLARALLLRLGERRHLFVLALHHIVSDGWSMRLLFQELAALYGAFSTGRPPLLPELPIQYADFAQWQREWLQGEALDRQLAYWRERLDGVPVLALPTDHPRPPVPTYAGASELTTLPPELCRALSELGRRQGVTLFITLLAAFAALLAGYTGQQDVALGAPIANRNRTELEGLVGFFVNTLVLRLDLSGDPKLEELLQRVRQMTLGAYAHQDLPFEKLVEELQPDRSLGHIPLFQVAFAFQEAPLADFELPGVAVTPLPLSTGLAKFELTLSAESAAGRLDLEVEYRTELFARTTIRRMLGHLRTLLAGMAADPGTRLSALELRTAGEQQEEETWNDTARAYPREMPVHRLFAERCEEAPDRVAVEFGEICLSYRELGRRADRLARRLRRLGAGPEEPVGIFLERSPELVVALLAVLAAGGAYVPLDPQQPVERLRAMLDDSGARLVVSRAAQRPERLAEDRCLVLLDAEDAGTQAGVEEELARDTGGSGVAYLMYTSGSTGRPKGIAVPHRAITRLVCNTDYAPLRERDRIAQVANSSFDAATFEIWGPLLNGGCVVGFERELTLSARELCDELVARGVSALFLTTALFNQVAQQAPAAFARLTYLLFGGEAVDPRPVRRVLEERAPERLLHVYGPTESTTFATWHQVKEVSAEAATVPIGLPIANTRVHLLDRWRRRAPVGIPGEIAIGGDGLARGYHGEPALTAERFVPDPFGAARGGRLYRTGDLARRRPDGALEFLGRLDDQVKVRGFRIEPAEIEAALAAHPEVREVVVAAREDAPGERCLVAYVVPEEGGRPDLQRSLRRFLADRIPEYMVPSAWVVLAALPLNANGKVDRRALPAPEAARCEPAGEPVAPRSPAEEIVAQIWSEVLRVERVSIHDSFFEFGGHSLLATQVVSRLTAVLGKEISLRALFETPTVAGLARQVEALAWGSRPAAPPIEPAPRDGLLPLSFAQQRLWFLEQMDPGGSVYSIFRALRLSGDPAPAILERALQEVERRHEALRTRFSRQAGGPVQVIDAPCRRPLPMVDLGGLDEAGRAAEVRRLSGEESCRPFDLAAGPLFRATLLYSLPGEHVLLLALHHIVADGWSMEILGRELVALYGACSSGEPSPLPELPVQYADFALWQRRWLAGEVLDEELGFWKRQLAGAPNFLDLPADRPRPPVQSSHGAQRRKPLAPKGLAALADLGRRSGATLFMTLLAAFEALLCRCTGQDDFLVGTPIANRNRLETEGLIGFFVNTLVLRTRLAGDPTFGECLCQARETALAAYGHQDLPFERLVEELRPERHLSHSPLVQVVFAFSDRPRQALGGAPLTLKPLPVERASSKFDLTLFADIGESAGVLAEYSTDLFDAATVLRFLAHFEVLLQEGAAAPERRLSQLAMLTMEERHQLLAEWNDTGIAGAPELPLDRRFESRAARSPDSLALAAGERRLTYGELDKASNRLAHHLRRLGVGPESIVAVLLDRSPELVIAALAVLKAGGAYLPLDPAYPPERLAWMLRDARPALLVSLASLPARVRPAEAPPLVLLDRDCEILARESPAALHAPVWPESLAYVIYTSGSTGRPKGVAVQHGSLLNLLAWHQQVYRVTPEDRATLVAAPGFDASIWELWPYLAAGACLLIPGDEERLAPARLAAWLEREAVTLCFLATPLAEALLAEGWSGRGALRALLTGGDRLHRAPVAGCGVRLVNHYGPTEGTVVATAAEIAIPADREPPIGRPIAGAEVYLLGRRLEAVPASVPAELAVGGRGLARGYLGDAALTAQAFLPDPWSGRPGARLYRTGDLVRHLPDGSLEFLGRIDHQVKLRGFRIELGDVEAALARHPAVREALAAVRADGTGQKRLVAYVVLRTPGEADGEELRGFLRELLPEYAVPSSLVLLEALPLSPNGKVDRGALPEPAAWRPRPVPVAPRNALERTLADIWEEVLGVSQVGRSDNFFDLGGHSLLIARVQDRLQTALGRPVPILDLFQHPTIRSLAELLTAGDGGPGALPRRGTAEARADSAARRREARREARQERRGRGERT